MLNRPAKYLLWSQISLYGFLAVCTVLLPQFLFNRNEGGVSNYGIHAKTITPYSLGFGLCAVFIFQAARVLPPKTKSYSTVRKVLALLSLLCLFAVVSTYTYKLAPLLKNIHQISAILLFFAEFFIGLWFGLSLHKDKLNLTLLGLEVFGVVLGALTFFGFLHVLFIAEVGAGIAFGVLMTRTIQKIT
jgi:hypothetical protein